MTHTNLLKLSLFGLLIAVSVFAGILSQQLELKGLIFIFVFTGLWVLSILIFKPSVLTTILFIAVYSLKPNFYSFYLCLFFIVLSSLVEFSGKEKQSFTFPFPVLISILFLAGIQAIVNARVFSDGFVYFATTILVPIITIMAINNSRIGENDLETWSMFIVFTAFILGLIGVVVAVMNPSSRIGSLWHTAMNINGFYVMAFFFALGFVLITQIKLLKYMYMVFAIVIFLGMLYTYTRITLAAIVFGFFLMMLKIRNLRKLFFLFVMLTPLVIPSSMMQRIQIGLTSDVSMLIRIIAWYNALILIGKNFFLGIGFDTWKHIYQSMVPYRLLYASHPHNVYLRVMVEMGIFGFLAYFGIIASILLKYYRNCVKPTGSNFDYAVFAAVAAILFSCITDVFIQQYTVSLPFWVTMALMYKKAIMVEQRIGVTA